MQKIYLNIIDILLLLYIIIAGFYSCLVVQNDFCYYDFTKWITFILFYFIAKNISQKQWCLWGIVLIGIIEVLIAISQKAHWIESFHSTFELTGTFPNPGPLGGFLAIVIVITSGLYLEYKKFSWQRHLLSIMMILLLIVIVLTNSRASWLAVLLGIVALFFIKIKRRLRTLSFLWKISIVVFLFLILIPLYYYKKDSADGRILIWRVSSEMIIDAPLFGHGLGAFSKEYMYYQAQYFEKNPCSKYAILADNVAFPYNEFLLIGVEQGVVGLVLVLLIILFVGMYSLRQESNRIYLGALTSWITFSMFSYSSQVLLLWLLLPLFLGGIKYQKKVCFSIRNKFRIIDWIIAFSCLIFVIHNGYIYYQLKENVKKLYTSSYQDVHKARIYIEMHQRELKSIPHLFDIYTQYSFRNNSDYAQIQSLEQAAIIIPNSELFCDLGDAYKELNQIDKAIEFYTLSSNMVPHRLLPNYKLFCLYNDIGDTIRMKKIGRKALNMHIKVQSTKTLRMLGDIKRILRN